MQTTTRTEYFLEMELIVLDERLCSALDRTTSLFEQAQEYQETAEAERIRKVKRILSLTKRALDRLS